MELIVRKATAEDYQAILDLDVNNKIYEGYDYVPAQLLRFMQDSDMSVAVGVANGRVVGMHLGCKVDDGETVVAMASRTHSEARGAGFWKALQEPEAPGGLCMKGVKHIAAITGSFWQNLKTKQVGSWAEPHFLCSSTCATFEFDPKAIQHKLIPTTSNGVMTRVLDAEESVRYLLDPETQWQVFPGKRILCDSCYILYRLKESNFERISRNSECITASIGPDNHCKSMSFSHCHETHNGYVYAISYYGNNPLDAEDVIRHSVIHLPIATKKQTKEPLLFRIIVPMAMQQADIAKGCEALPGFIRQVNEPFVLVAMEQDKREKIGAKL